MNPERQGYLGDLANKSVPELQELLSRQDAILKKVKFVENLPDGGRKIRAFRNKLLHLLDEKSSNCDTNTTLNNFKQETKAQQVENLDVTESEGKRQTRVNFSEKENSDIKTRPQSKFSSQLSNKVVQNVKQAVTNQVTRDVVSMETNNSGNLSGDINSQEDFTGNVEDIHKDWNTCITKETDFEKLRDKSSVAHDNEIKTERKLVSPIQEQNLEYVNNRKKNPALKSQEQQMIPECSLEDEMMKLQIGNEEKSLEYEKIRAKIFTKSTEVVPCFKANSSLKIKKVADLPEKYKCKSRLQPCSSQDTLAIDKQQACHPITNRSTSHQGMPTVSHKQHTCLPITNRNTSHQGMPTVSHIMEEETAATPPKYRYGESKLISLGESFHLQQVQQKQQEELQAWAAAERLGRMLNIKMDQYYPEGANIVYRTQVEAEDVDSDDEPEMEFYSETVD